MSDPQASAPKAWTHTPSRLTIFWLLLSVPLVAWDFGFILLRPHSMPGGWLHDPLWLPYAQYVKIDHTYGMEAYEAREGFPVALAVVNIFETLAYVTYLWIVYRYGGRFAVGVGRGASGGMGWLGKGVEVGGVPGGLAVLIGYATAVITLSKTVLFGMWLSMLVGKGQANCGSAE